MNIYLIRHGEKSSDGLTLTSRGKKQVKSLIKRLRNLDLNKIYSSEIDRCKATTELIIKKIKIPVVYDAALREVEGVVKEKPEKYVKEINIIKRIYNKLTKEKGNVLVVGSGNINRILIALFLEINPKNSRFVQIPTGMTHIEEKKEGGFRIVFINDTSHLPERLKIRQAY